MDKSENKLQKQTKKLLEEKEKAKDDAVVEISIGDVMTLDPSGSGAISGQNDVKGEGKASPLIPTAEGPVDDSDSNSEVEEQEKALKRKRKGKSKGVRAFEQHDLVARAFAGDNVVQVCFRFYSHSSYADLISQVI